MRATYILGSWGENAEKIFGKLFKVGFNDMTTKYTILKAIRQNCLDCCCHSVKEIELCQVKCPLKPFRFGKDPSPSRINNIEKSHLTQDEFFQNSGLKGIDSPISKFGSKNALGMV